MNFCLLVKHSTFSVFHLVKLSNFLKYWYSFSRNTGVNYAPVSIWKYICAKNLSMLILIITCVIYLQIMVEKN